MSLGVVGQVDSPAGASEPDSNAEKDLDYDSNAMNSSPPPPSLSATRHRLRPSSDSSEYGSRSSIHCLTNAIGNDNAKKKSRCRTHLGLELEIPETDEGLAVGGTTTVNGAVATLSDLVKSLTPDQVQRALSGVYRKHQFEPRSQPACTPSTVKYILSLVTPSTGQPPALKSPEQQPTSQSQQHQQQQTVSSSKRPDLAALLRQYISGPLASPSALPYIQALTNGAASVGAKPASGASPVVQSPLLYHATAGGILAAAAAAAAAAEAQKGSQASRGAALVYQQLLLSSPIAAATALSAARAAEPPPGTATDRTATVHTDLSSTLTDPATKLPASILKLDPNHTRYMDFLHNQSAQLLPPQQPHTLNASSFLPSFGNSNPMMPLNFGAGGFLSGQEPAGPPSDDTQLFLPTVSQHLPSQPPSSQQQQCLLLGEGAIDVKQEKDFIHDPAGANMPIPSSATANSGGGESSMKRVAASGADFSDASSAGAGDLDGSGGYGHGGNMFNDEDQEMKKLERKRARNRMAASKCRQRKLERISELEDQVRHYQTEGLLLQSEIHQLRRQLDELNETVSRHRMAGCVIAAPFKLSNV